MNNTIKVKVFSPDGVILSNNESNLTDQSQIFTIEEVTMFNGEEKKLKWKYVHNSEFNSGIYKYELQANNKLIQRGSFSLK